MKPSISIDLPGWCTLKNRDNNESGRNGEPALEDTTPGSTGAQDLDLDDRGSSSAGNANGNGSAGESDDDDGAIARLFSIGGVKTRRGSQSHQHTSGRDSGNKNGSGGRARRGSAGFELQAEAFLDWPCVRCTFINAYTEDACGGCGGGNRKRERLLRERREEVERLGRLQSARECRDRSLKEEAFKDLLDDSGDSDDGDGDVDDANSRTPATPAEQSSPTEAAAEAEAAAAPAVDSSTSTSTSSVVSGPDPRRGAQACVIGTLPPDLLLQCAEYLGDARSLCRVREVCHGWVVTLDDREAGQRLWRPLFYRLRASGSIHRATDATGQQHRNLKVYDLGIATATPPGNNRSAVVGAAANIGKGPATGGVSMSTSLSMSVSTPSPLQQHGSATLSAGRSSSSSAANSAGKSPGGSSAQRFACVVCSLIQREGYSGRDCEMCASSLVLVHGRESPAAPAPATPRLAYTRVNLSGGGAAPSPSNAPPFSSPPRQRQQQQGEPRSGSGSDPPSAGGGRGRDNSHSGGTAYSKGSTVPGAAGAGAARGGVASGGSIGGVRGREDEEEGEGEEGLGEGARSIDWHFLVKRLAEEKRIAGGWGSLHHGWVWLQRALQNMLRRRRGHEPLGATPSRAVSSSGSGCPQAAPPALSGDSSGGGVGTGRASRLGAQQHQQQQMSAPAAASRQVGDGELDPTIARLVRKLASKKWVLLYDSLKATFTLQAEGVAREVVFEAMAAAASAAARDALGDGKAGGGGAHHERRGAAAAELEGLRGCVAAWEAYKDWCEEVDMYCELLNEQISAERYRTAGAGCGRGDNTPYIRDTALLSFRHSFALNVQICAMLRSSIMEGMPTAAMDAEGSPPPESGPRRKASRHEAEASSAAKHGDDFSSRDMRSTARSPAVGKVGAAAAAGDTEELFTDLELMEDSRAIDFSVRTFSGPGICGGGGGGAAGRAGGKGATGSGGGGSGGGGGASKGSRALSNTSVLSRSSRGSSRRPGNYYDWFLSKLEGKEMGIIRGDIDARGKSVKGGGAGAAGGGAACGVGNGDGDDGGGGLRTATLSELLEMVHDMVEELDVPDDGLSKDRHTQGAMRRLLFLPIKRWQAAVAEANNAEEDPRNLLLAGLSPAPGEGGFHRLRGGAAGRRKGTPPMSSLKKDAGKSWEHLSTLFG